MGSKLDVEAVAREVFSRFEFMAGVTPAEYELALTRAGALAAYRECINQTHKTRDIVVLRFALHDILDELEKES